MTPGARAFFQSSPIFAVFGSLSAAFVVRMERPMTESGFVCMNSGLTGILRGPPNLTYGGPFRENGAHRAVTTRILERFANATVRRALVELARAGTTWEPGRQETGYEKLALASLPSALEDLMRRSLHELGNPERW